MSPANKYTQPSVLQMLCHSLYLGLQLLQVVQKTRNPVQITSYTEERLFVMPNIVLCSFGTYNLNRFTAQYPTRYGNSYELTHDFADLLSDSAANYSFFNVHEKMDAPGVFGATDLITFRDRTTHTILSREKQTSVLRN